MAKKQATSQQSVPSTEAEEQSLSLEPPELAAPDPSTPATITVSLPEEIFARGGDGYYTRHWGINE
jgi:hypothetical protein